MSIIDIYRQYSWRINYNWGWKKNLQKKGIHNANVDDTQQPEIRQNQMQTKRFKVWMKIDQCNSQSMLFQQEETETRNNQPMLQQMVYLNSKGEKGNVISSIVMIFAWKTMKTCGARKRNKVAMDSVFHLQPIQQEMLPKPKEKQGNKQRTSVFWSNKNCLKPSGG